MEFEKIKLVFSDLHLGSGKLNDNGSLNIWEDFFEDERFIELIDYYEENYKIPIEIILNGDILNLIAVDFDGTFPYIITEHISLCKVQKIISGHTLFFQRLKKFLENPQNNVTYILGNHDVEVIWQSVRDLIDFTVNRKINYRLVSYFFDGIWIEHGHQYEIVNRIEPKRMFMTSNLPEAILNLPWGSLFVINCINLFKIKKPHIDKIKPLKMFTLWSFFFDTLFFFEFFIIMIIYFLIPIIKNKKYQFPALKINLKNFTALFKSAQHEKVAQRIIKTYKEINTVIMGHTHVHKFTPLGNNKTYINTGTWTEITSLNLSTLGKQTKLTYIFLGNINLTNQYQIELLNWQGKNVPFKVISS